jgi:hypothetical protein
MYNLIEQYLSLGKLARGLEGKPVLFMREVDRILIHWIGPYSKQTVYSPWYWWEDGSNGQGVQASAHLVVKDTDVLQALPFNEVGWHSGDTRNRHAIGIEVIPVSDMGDFSQTTIKTLRECVKLIRQTHPNAKIIERHFDGTQGKDCPRYYTPVTNLVGVDRRIENPEGGNDRWEMLRKYLDVEAS